MKSGFLYRYLVVLLLTSLALTSCRLGLRDGQSPPAQETQPTTAATTSTSAPTATPQVETLTFQAGRNDYVITVDDTPREFLVYIPAGYDASQPTPLVFMFHGSNQGGPLMYENTKWKEKADEENLIVVFPTAWKYPLIGESGRHEKWNDVTLFAIVEPGTELKDDVKFVREMLARLEATFNVDETRVFATGFSNGGSFVSSRLVFEMSDVFAAFAICGSGVKAGREELTENMPESVAASLYTIMGTNDEKIAEGTGHPRPFPLEADAILADDLFGPTLTNTAVLLSLDPAQYQVESENAYTRFLFEHSTVGADNEYIFLMVENMGHVYPSVDNNRYDLDAADLFWEFFVRHARR
ncbi:MAG: PHB depolymerase family esterase [Chloroflexota bacterium]